MNSIHERIVDAAIAVCDNAANLPGGYAQVPEEITEELADALIANSEREEKMHGKVLNSIEASIERVSMDDDQLAIERLIDAADRLYGACFDKALGKGHYIISKNACDGVRYFEQVEIANFRDSLRAFLNPS